MSKKINLVLEKKTEKVSFDVNSSRLDTLDIAIKAIKMIRLFSDGNQSFDLFKNESLPNYLDRDYNRDTLMNRMLQYMMSEKAFELGDFSYSLKDLASFYEIFKYDYIIDEEIPLHKLVKFRTRDNIRFFADENYLDEVYKDLDNVQDNCIEMTIEQTEHFLMELIEIIEFDVDDEKLKIFASETEFISRSDVFCDIYGDEIISFSKNYMTKRLGEITDYVLNHERFDSIFRTKVLRNLIFNENHDTSIDLVEIYYKYSLRENDETWY